MTTWVRDIVTARKPHRCVICFRRIDPGEKYLRGVELQRGEPPRRWHECMHCHTVQVMYDISDNGEYDQDLFDYWTQEPRDVRELRHAAGYRMQWRTSGGTLLAIPTRD